MGQTAEAATKLELVDDPRNEVIIAHTYN